MASAAEVGRTIHGIKRYGGTMDETRTMENSDMTPPAAKPAVYDADDPLARPSYPIVEPGSQEEQIKLALRQVFDPEIGLEVVQLGLIREIDLKSDPNEVKMMLTTPFCPYGGWLIQQIKDVSEGIVGKSIKVTVLPDLWDLNYMEDPGLLSGW